MTIREQFLSMLKECHGYPFDEIKDSLLFDISIAEYPCINILQQTAKKIAWWKEHPDALKYNPRRQLDNWFMGENEFQQRGGPQQLGKIMQEVRDKDHRNWLKQFAGISGKRRNY